MLGLKACVTIPGLAISFKGVYYMTIYNLFKQFSANRHLFPVFITEHAFTLGGKEESVVTGIKSRALQMVDFVVSQKFVHAYKHICSWILRGGTGVN